MYILNEAHKLYLPANLEICKRYQLRTMICIKECNTSPNPPVFRFGKICFFIVITVP